MGHSDEPCSLVGVATTGCFGEEVVQRLGGVAPFVEPRVTSPRPGVPSSTPFLSRCARAHQSSRSCRPGGVRRCSVGPPHDGTLALVSEAVHVEAEHGWGDSGDRGAPQGTLVCLVELADVDPLRRRLLRLTNAVDDQSSTAVGHRGDIFRKSVCGSPFAGGSSDFQSKSFVCTRRRLPRHRATRWSTVPGRPRARGEAL